MKYNVTVQTGQQINVGIESIKASVSLDELNDVDATGIQNNYIMMYDASSQIYKFVHPSEILDRADGVNNGSLDYGNY